MLGTSSLLLSQPVQPFYMTAEDYITTPISIRIDSFIPDPTLLVPIPWGGVTSGDNRTFGEPGTSRTSQTIIIDPYTLNVSLQPLQIGETKMVTWNGNLVTGFADSSGITTTVEYLNGGGAAMITMACSATNPLVAGAPAINYSFTFFYNIGSPVIGVRANTDGFPATELWINNFSVMRIHAGSSVFNLLPTFGDTTSSTAVMLNGPNGTVSQVWALSIPSLFLSNTTFLAYPSGSVSIMPMAYWDVNTSQWVPLTPNG